MKNKSTDFINTEAVEPLSDPSDSFTYPVPAPVEMVKVKLLDFIIHEGNYLVADESGAGYLVPVSKLQYDSGWQEVAKRDLELADRPYNLDSEIQRLLVKPSDVKKALWSMGIVTQEDAAKADVREMVAKLIMKGVLPIVQGE